MDTFPLLRSKYRCSNHTTSHLLIGTAAEGTGKWVVSGERADREHRVYNEGLRAKPQRGSGAESLLKKSGGKLHKPGSFLSFRC